VSSPLSLLWWAISQHLFLVALAVITLGVVLAFAIFGGGWQ
jgi:hypothetical protein